MKCYQPYTVWHDHLQASEYPCGRCLACRQLRARDWAQRLKYELENNTKRGDFVTFTTDDAVAQGYQGILLDKAELQRLFKRIRHHHTIKYYACGEYGEKHGRAHYHAIIIRNATREIPYHKYWKQGAVHVGTVTEASIAYCTGYLLKANPVPLGIPREHRPFHIWSRRIGDQWMTGKTFIEMSREGNIPRRWRALADPSELPKEEWKTGSQILQRWQKYGLRKEQKTYHERHGN